jgi:hypothetical protein
VPKKSIALHCLKIVLAYGHVPFTTQYVYVTFTEESSQASKAVTPPFDVGSNEQLTVVFDGTPDNTGAIESKRVIV